MEFSFITLCRELTLIKCLGQWKNLPLHLEDAAKSPTILNPTKYMFHIFWDVMSIYQFIMIFYNYSTFKYWNTFIRYAIILPVARLQVMEKTDCRPLLSPIKMFQITVSKPRISQLTKSTQVHIIPPPFLLKTLPCSPSHDFTKNE